MIVQRGITGFFNWDERGGIPEFSFADFKRIVFAVTRPFSVSKVIPRAITPNFHSALLVRDNVSISILGHSTYPLIAFAEPLQPVSCHLQFIDCEGISRECARLFPHVRIATAAELDQSLTELDIAQLDTVERDQIKYWQPHSVGEVAFNWWD